MHSLSLSLYALSQTKKLRKYSTLSFAMLTTLTGGMGNCTKSRWLLKCSGLMGIVCIVTFIIIAVFSGLWYGNVGSNTVGPFDPLTLFLESVKIINVKAPRHKAESKSFPKLRLAIGILLSYVKITLSVIKPRLLPSRIKITIQSRPQLKSKMQTLRLRLQRVLQRPYRKRD